MTTPDPLAALSPRERGLRLIIAGSRGFNDYALLAREADGFTLRHRYPDCCWEIVSGGARGADRLGERYAEERGLPVKLFPAEWEVHGAAAGPIRNRQMAEYATHLLAFWDGQSRGTAHMIEEAKKRYLTVQVVRYKD